MTTSASSILAPAQWRRRLTSDAALALLAGLLAFALYLATMSPSVVNDDGGELQMLARALGVAHPTGYPLFILLSWAFSYLPLGGDVAFRVTLLCALCAAGAMAFFFLAARELGAGRVPALAAALLAASIPRIWMHASAAEVYSFANLLMLFCSWLLLRWGAGKTPLWVVTLAFGFGLTHHISQWLFGPAALAYVLLVEPRLPLRPRRWLPAVLALLLPLTLYAYIPLRATYFMAQPELAGPILGVRRLVASGLVTPHYFEGGTLGLILAFGYSRGFVSGPGISLDILRRAAAMGSQQWPLLIVVPLALIGVVALLRRRARASAYLILAYLVNTLAAVRFLASVGEDGDHRIPGYLLTALLFSVGATALLAGLRRRAPAWLPAILAGALFLLPLYSVINGLPAALARRQLDTGPQARQALSGPLPQGAVIAGPWTDITPLRYFQRAEGLRPDVWAVATDTNGTRLLAGRAIAARYPFYVARQTPAGLRLLPLPLWDAGDIEQPADLRLNDAVRWRGYDLDDVALRTGRALLLTLYWQTDAPAGQDWATFIHLVDERGEKVAQTDATPVGPFYSPAAWAAGLLLADQYELALPAGLPAGTYRLLFGAYRGDGRLNWADGQDAHVLAEITL
jgi:hypothetical protein